MKKLIPAIVLLLISAMIMATASYAWFSMNTTVTATGMQVKAQAEDGIVIASYSDASTAPVDADFDKEDSTYITTVTEMKPTFTSTTSTWYHAASTQSNDGQTYDATVGYTSVDNAAAVLYASFTEYNTAKGTTLTSEQFAALSEAERTKTPAVNYYQLNKFQIKSTGSEQAVYVKAITVKVGENAPAQEYSPALRVLVKTDEHTLIFAPVGSHTGAALTETISASLKADDDLTSDESITLLAVNKLAAKALDDVGATPEDVFIYIFFDGEDAACKSDNIPADAFEKLEVTVQFTTDTPAD